MVACRAEHRLISRPMEHSSDTSLANRSSLPSLPSPRWGRALLVAAALVLVAHLGDEIAWRLLRDPRVNDRDWGRFLRSMGYLPLWIALGVGVALERRPAPGAWRQGFLLILAPALGGAAAELLKLVFRRLRPDPETFGYVFRSFAEAPLSTRGLGLPSSHVMVAFGGAAALAALFPGARYVGYVLATGCALTRVMSGQHFLSDATLAATLGWFVGTLVARRMLRPSA